MLGGFRGAAGPSRCFAYRCLSGAAPGWGLQGADAAAGARPLCAPAHPGTNASDPLEWGTGILAGSLTLATFFGETGWIYLLINRRARDDVFGLGAL